MVCEHHHARVHAEMWQDRIGCDGHPEYIPPGWVDARGMRELHLGYTDCGSTSLSSPPG